MGLSRILTFCIALSVLTATQAHAAVFVSDDFSSGSIDLLVWTPQDPLTGSGFSVINNELAITIPSGPNHDLWTTGNDSVRLLQPTDDIDFEAEIKFSSVPSQGYQMQGILVEQDASNFIRFEFLHDGAFVRVYSATIIGGLATTRVDVILAAFGGALYMRVSRTGDQWTQEYSIDGLNWNTATTFNQPMTVNNIGPFAGNYAAPGPAPAFTSLVDYFFNTASPIDPEDGGVTGPDTTPPFIFNVSVTAVSDTEISANWNTDEPADGFIEWGLTEGYELGSMSDAALTNSHSFSIPALQPDTTYQVRFTSTDESDNTASSQNYEIYTSALPVFDIWYGTNQSFGYIGQAQEWVNILGRVTDPDGIVSLTYSLNGGPTEPLTVGPNDDRLAALGDFNIEIGFAELVVGANSVLITAQDGQGFIETETVTIDYAGEMHLALDYSVDWSVVANIQDVAQIVDGLWTLDADKVRPLELGYDRLLAVGDEQFQNYQVTVPITVHGLDPYCNQNWCAGGGPFIGVMVRWPGHINLQNEQPNAGWFPTGALGGIKWISGDPQFEFFRGSDGAIVGQDFSASMPFEVPHVFKLLAKTTGSEHQYKVKFWPQNETEPAAWSFTLDEPLTEIDSGSVLLIAHHVDASIGDVVIAAVDEVAPIVSNVQISPAQDSATITWDTDEPATSRVDIGWSNAYELGAETDDTLKTSHSIVLPKLWAGLTYHFKISSTDSSGNMVMEADATFMTQAFTGTCNGCHQ